MRFLHLPTTDLFSAPSQGRLEEGVEYMLGQQEGGTVYVHCKVLDKMFALVSHLP